MVKLFNISILAFVLALSFSLQAFAKSPPPGSGSADVPANILIMLDTSGSMGTYISSGDSRYPVDVAFDSDGNSYVAKYYDRVEKYDSDGNFVLSWGGYGFSNGKFDYTFSIDIDSNDNVYVSDYRGDRIQKFDTEGNWLDTIDVSGSRAYGIAIDSNDNLYALNGSGSVQKFNSSGVQVGSTWSNTYGRHLAIDGTTVYITKYYSDKVQKYDLDGNYLGQFSVNDPYGIDVGDDGYLYISRPNYGRIYKYSTSGSYQTYYGGWGYGSGYFRSPRGVTTAPDGTIYAADFYNHRIQSTAGDLLTDSASKTRLDAAKNVIKTIVSDSNLTSGANFGLMTWNSSASMNVNVSDTGAASIFNSIDSLTDGGGTYLDYAMNLAESYFTGSSSPMEPNASCQQNILIVISDGYWIDNTASSTAEDLYNNYGIKTFVIGFTSAGDSNYVDLSTKGGTYPDSPLYAENESTLLDVLASYIRQIISTQLTFTVPTIIPGITNSDHILQSTFLFKNDHQWKGHLYKYSLNSDGTPGSLIWDAGTELNSKAATDRNIWTVVEGMDQNLNNFTTTNLERLRLPLEENSGTSYTDTELTDLIDFVRGVDSYGEFSGGVDDDGDAIIEGERWKLADVYHSKAVAVGSPSAFYSDEVDTDSESYYRYLNNYKYFKTGSSCGGNCATRDETIFVGSNSGMLHAFDSDTGEEKWAFVPPSILPSLRNIISTENAKSVGIYGVDGSPAIKDIFVDGAWKTILLCGLRQGGHSYFALDITDVENPTHLFTFAYNKFTDTVSYWDENNSRTDFDASSTIEAEYDYSEIGESWSDPVIMNIKIGSTKKWVAVFGGGYNNNINPNYGSVVYVIDLEDGGKVLKKINIADQNSSNGITNSIPARLTVITADTSTSFPYAGGLVYFTDIDGSLWKLNLSSNGTLYSKSRMFDAESTYANDRMCYHELSPTILSDGRIINYFGTADMSRIGDVDSAIANRAYGVIDGDYPNSNVSSDFTVSSMVNVTTTGSTCPTTTDKGWYVDLDANEKITANATVRNSTVVFSKYTPSSTNLCSSGTSKIVEYSHACGNNLRETDLGEGMATEAIIYKNKLYIGISSDVEVTNLPSGFVKEGNLIVGDPVTTSQTNVKIEYWKEDF